MPTKNGEPYTSKSRMENLAQKQHHSVSFEKAKKYTVRHSFNLTNMQLVSNPNAHKKFLTTYNEEFDIGKQFDNETVKNSAKKMRTTMMSQTPDHGKRDAHRGRNTFFKIN